MIRFHLYIDKDAEETMLNEMCKKGYAFQSRFLGFYRFVCCRPKEYLYRIDLAPLSKFNEYRKGLEAGGTEIVKKSGFFACLRRKADQGAFEPCPDPKSQALLYLGISSLLRMVAILEFTIVLMELILFFLHPHWLLGVVGILLLLFGVWLLSMSLAMKKRSRHLQ